MGTRIPSPEHLDVAAVRTQLDALLDRVNRDQEHLLVEEGGQPVAAIISAADYEHFRRLLAQETLLELGPRMAAEAERQGLTEEALLAEIKTIRQEVNRETYGRLFHS